MGCDYHTGEEIIMRKSRIAGVVVVICLLLAVSGADQEKLDAFQANIRREGSVAECASEDAGGEKDVCLTVEDTEGEEALQEDDSDKMSAVSYTKAYRQFLEAYREEKEDASGARIMLALIDDDNVPELLLFEDDCHAAVVKVYTCNQESVIELGGFGSFGRMQYVERGGMIFDAYTGQGRYDSAFFQMEDHEARQICFMSFYAPPDGSPEIFEIDDAGVTEEVYQKKWQELYGTYEYVLVRYDDAFPLSESEPGDLLAKAKDALLVQRDSSRLAVMVEEQSAVLEGYGAFLTEYAAEQKEEGGEEPVAFALIYLDGDDVPELVVMDGNAHLCDVFVYRFEEGRTVPVGTYGQYGTLFYREKEGIVFDSFDSFGDTYDYIYQIEGSRETLLHSLSERNLTEDGELLGTVYTVDGEEVSWEQYREIYEKWYEEDDRKVDYNMCRKLADMDIRESLTEELENLILTQEEVLKNNLLYAAEAQKSDILLWDYDDYDGDGRYEAFMIVGNILEGTYESMYSNATLWFAGADGSTSHLVSPFNSGYRMIDGKMDFGSRKYLYFYSDRYTTANISEIWTVRDGKPVEESNLYQIGEVIYRGENERDEFEIWVDAYDAEHDIDFECDIDVWIGHTWKPYFYHYNSDSDRIEAYGGKILSEGAFKELSGRNIIEEIREKGYTVGDVIRWDNDVVTINYERHNDFGVRESFYYENVIWDNNVKDFWRKEEMHATSWENAGLGGSYGL